MLFIFNTTFPNIPTRGYITLYYVARRVGLPFFSFFSNSVLSGVRSELLEREKLRKITVYAHRSMHPIGPWVF